MGLISDVAKGKVDYVHADIENISDSRNWPYPKKKVTMNPPDDGEKEQKHEVQNPDSTNEEE